MQPLPVSVPLAPASANPAVEVRNASVVYQTADTPVKALSDIDLRINEGEFVSLIGPSGCGKTTLLRVIADLEQISAGSVLVNVVASGIIPTRASSAAVGTVPEALTIKDDAFSTSPATELTASVRSAELTPRVSKAAIKPLISARLSPRPRSDSLDARSM